jgi:hypothetical protein
MRYVAIPVLVATAAITGAAAPLPLAIAQPLTAVQGQLLITALPAGSHDLRLDGQPVHLDGDGRFMLGVDRDFAGTKALEWVTQDGRSARRDLVVAGREWIIDRLPARLGPVTWATALRNLEYEAKREAEVAPVEVDMDALALDMEGMSLNLDGTPVEPPTEPVVEPSAPSIPEPQVPPQGVQG